MNLKTDVIKEMEDYVGEQLGLLLPVEKCWQPADILPSFESEQWRDQVETLRKSSAATSDEVLAILTGNTITEEALPSYQSWISRLQGIGGHDGTHESPWAQWARGWTAEENRHGDILKTYLYLSGKVDMRSVEITTQHLIRNGFDPLTGTDPYEGLVYTSVQEKATAISHNNTARLAAECGDAVLEKICRHVARDEVRHEQAYKLFFKKVLELDPNGGLESFANMMDKKVIMPAQTMTDGAQDLFAQHVLVCQRMKIYTSADYAKVIEHVLDFWDIANLTGLSPEGAKAQETLCGLPKHYARRAERMAQIIAKQPKTPCPWIFGRPI